MVASNPYEPLFLEEEEKLPPTGKSTVAAIDKRSVVFAFSIVLNFLLCLVIFGGNSPYGLSVSNLLPGIWFDGLQNPSLATFPSFPSSDSEDTTLKKCPPPHPLSASPPAPINLWAPLTVPEIAAIESWLFSPQQNLNLTEGRRARISDNAIFLIESWMPQKQEALEYLKEVEEKESDEEKKRIKRPQRYARVIINFGGWKEPMIKDYLVGPLEESFFTDRQSYHANVTMRELKEIYHREEIPFNAYAYGITAIDDLVGFLSSTVQPIAEIMEDLFGGQIRSLPNDTLVGGISGPLSFDGSFRRLWMTWRRNHAGSYLLPVGFYQYVDVSGTDAAMWKVLKLVYHDQVFSSLEEFAEAYHNGTLVRRPPPHTFPAPPSKSSSSYKNSSNPSSPLDFDWSWTERTRPHTYNRDLDHLPGPRSVSFSGLRYRLSLSQSYLSWLGWSFYLSFDRDMGLRFFDIRFRGDRIIYELAPQEAMAQYTGRDPVQSSTAWLDRHFGMGALARPLIPQYDCPAESTYVGAVTYTPLGVVKVDRAICVFEMDSGKPVSRHFGPMKGETGAVKGYVLTVRSVVTVGNYDYLFDYIFNLDGTIEVKLSASGYMQGGYWTPEQDAYGGRIRDMSMGNLHDHVINYKVDFDIAGTQNSLLKTSTIQEVISLPWLSSEDEWGSTVTQQKIIKEYITNETDALLKWPENYRGGYAIVNKDNLNRWGYPRGYAIHPGYNSIYNTIVGSPRLLNNANWARYNLAVSRRKETEPSSSSLFNLNLPKEPMVDFHKFFDGESINQEDLVLWANLGMHHFPQAEDSPNTKTTIATSSFILTPLNYFDSDVSIELRNAVLLNPPTTQSQNHNSPSYSGDDILTSVWTHEDYGVKQDITCLPVPPEKFEYKDAKAYAVARGGQGGVSGLGEEIQREELSKYADGYLRIRLGV